MHGQASSDVIGMLIGKYPHNKLLQDEVDCIDMGRNQSADCKEASTKGAGGYLTDVPNNNGGDKCKNSNHRRKSGVQRCLILQHQTGACSVPNPIRTHAPVTQYTSRRLRA